MVYSPFGFGEILLVLMAQMKEGRSQLGHHSIQITVDTYGHLIPGANREAVNRLAAMIEIAPLARLEEKRG